MRREETLRFLIETKYARLRSSEKKAADYILNHLGQIAGEGLAEVAAKSGVSQPTVVRFVKALGFESYKEFKYRMITECSRETEEGSTGMMYGYTVNKSDRREDVPAKIVATSIRMLEEMLKSVSVEEFGKVVDAILGAGNIDIYGVENSAAVCSDLYTKLIYLGLNCRYYSDTYVQRICAGNLKETDVAVGISYSGYSKDTVEALKTAKKKGAVTIAITNFQDALIGKYADYVISSTQEQFLYGADIFSRATQLAIVDMIYLGIIQTDYERFRKVLDQNSEMIKDKAY